MVSIHLVYEKLNALQSYVTKYLRDVQQILDTRHVSHIPFQVISWSQAVCFYSAVFGFQKAFVCLKAEQVFSLLAFHFLRFPSVPQRFIFTKLSFLVKKKKR